MSNAIDTYTENFLTSLGRLKIDIGRIISIHYPEDGRKVMMADMMRAVGRAQ